MNILLLNCIIYNVLALTALLLLLKKNPRYMMQDYPKEILKSVEEKTAKEKRESLLFGFPFISILLLYPVLLGFYGKFVVDNGFLVNWLTIFLLVFSFNVVDLLILDWLLFCFITPGFIIIPGTEGNPGYKNYWFHFHGFLKGCGFSIIGSFVISSVIEVLGLLI